MCNEYDAPGPEQLEAFFDVQIPDDLPPWRTSQAPLTMGPYLKAGQLLQVGQWGMIPPGSTTRIPTLQPRKTDPPGTKPKKLSTNNARNERMATAHTYRGAWKAGHRCLIPAWAYFEPYYGIGKKNIYWRLERADGAPWALAGLWSEWTDHATGEVVPNFTMLTQNCDAHPLLKLLHKPEVDRQGNVLPPEEQDKRSVVPLEGADWDAWLHGTAEQAQRLIRLPTVEVFKHGPRDTRRRIVLDLATGEGKDLDVAGELF